MSISPVNGVGRVAAAAADPPTVVNPARQAQALPEQAVDHFTQQPLPPRFPWLSRLALQLEAASRQRAAFAPAPPLGDHLDRSA